MLPGHNKVAHRLFPTAAPNGGPVTIASKNIEKSNKPQKQNPWLMGVSTTSVGRNWYAKYC